MQIVINIPDEKYERLVYLSDVDLKKYIKKGTPLPKGHGRLIDADKTKDVMMDVMCGTGYQGDAMCVVESEYCSPTVVEAHKWKGAGDEVDN